MDFCKDIVIIIYNYIHRDLMKYVVSEYKNSVVYCNNKTWEHKLCGCGGEVCEMSIFIRSGQTEYNYRYQDHNNFTIYNINGNATKYKLPPKYYYSL